MVLREWIRKTGGSGGEEGTNMDETMNLTERWMKTCRRDGNIRYQARIHRCMHACRMAFRMGM